MTLDLLFVGFGNVAQRFVTLAADERRRLAREHGLELRIVGACTRRRGAIFAPRGIGGTTLLELVSGDRPFGPQEPATAFIRRSAARLPSARAGRLVVIETTTLDVTQGQPATSHVLAALRARAHVVTANKGPVAFAHHRLAHAAARAKRDFLFESATMDGVPVFNLVRTSLPAVRVTGFRGVVNSTTNFILTAMENGEKFADALAEMQRLGIAETDASLDIDGWDAAAKTAALANVLLGARITPHDVDRLGIGEETRTRAVAARSAGRRLKLVAAARTTDGKVHARVGPAELPAGDLLAGLEGEQNAIVLETDLLGEIAVVQLGSGLTQTAYGLLSDVVTIGRARAGAPSGRTPSRRGRR